MLLPEYFRNRVYIFGMIEQFSWSCTGLEPHVYYMNSFLKGIDYLCTVPLFPQDKRIFVSFHISTISPDSLVEYSV